MSEMIVLVTNTNKALKLNKEDIQFDLGPLIVTGTLTEQLETPINLVCMKDHIGALMITQNIKTEQYFLKLLYDIDPFLALKQVASSIPLENSQDSVAMSRVNIDGELRLFTYNSQNMSSNCTYTVHGTQPALIFNKSLL